MLQQDTIITITELAVIQFKEILSEQEEKDDFIRIWVSSGGCSGLAYGMSVDNSTDDVDERFEIEGIPFVVDKISLKYIKGSTIDHTGGLMGAFKFENKLATKKCGCGTSFAVDSDADALGLDTTRYGGCGSCSSTK